MGNFRGLFFHVFMGKCIIDFFIKSILASALKSCIKMKENILKKILKILDRLKDRTCQETYSIVSCSTRVTSTKDLYIMTLCSKKLLRSQNTAILEANCPMQKIPIRIEISRFLFSTKLFKRICKQKLQISELLSFRLRAASY